jgi:ERCC4-type nuclease
VSRTIYVDTREQKPLKFNFPIEVKTLKFGDYSFSDRDATCNCYVERKSLQDFVGTLSGGFDRFCREIERSKDSDANFIVVIESDFNDVAGFQFLREVNKKVKATPEYIMHNVRDIIQKYPHVQFLFVKGRKEAVRVIEKIFTCKCLYKEVDLQLAYDTDKL